MAETDHARSYTRHDGTSVRALQYNGRVAGFYGLLAAFPGRVLPHPQRDDAVLIITTSDRRVRVEAGDWVTEQLDGSLQTDPDDQFHLRQDIVETIAA